MELTVWQRMRRRYAHWRDGFYTYPDGTVEYRDERIAGINVFRDDLRTRRMKYHQVRIREHERERFAGAVMTAAPAFYLLTHDPAASLWQSGACVLTAAAGLYWMTKPFYPPPPPE